MDKEKEGEEKKERKHERKERKKQTEREKEREKRERKKREIFSAFRRSELDGPRRKVDPRIASYA